MLIILCIFSRRLKSLEKTFADKLDLIIDGGENKNRIPSTVVSVLGDSFDVIREGAIPKIELLNYYKKIFNG